MPPPDEKPNVGFKANLVNLIPEYTGEKGGIHLQKLLKYIDQYAVIEGWLDQHKLAVLNAKCVGEAGIVLEHAITAPTKYDEAVKLLKERFLPKLTTSRLITSLTEARQRPDESVMRFVDRLSLLMNKGKHTYLTTHGEAAPEPVIKLMEETLVATLQKGLRVERIKASLIASEPQDLASARETLKKLEAREEEFFPSPKRTICAIQRSDSDIEDFEDLTDPPREAEHATAITQVTALIQEAVNHLEAQSKLTTSATRGTTPPNRETRSCWYCSKVGHLARECKRKKRDFQRDTRPKCFRCGRPGHIKAQCRASGERDPTPRAEKPEHVFKGSKDSLTPKNGRAPLPQSE